MNFILHEMFMPDRDARPFGDHLTFSYDYIMDDVKWVEERGKGDYEDLVRLRALPQEYFVRLRALPQEHWGEVVDNYLVFWSENQGCWLAGIKVEDMGQSDPVCLWRRKRKSSCMFENI